VDVKVYKSGGYPEAGSIHDTYVLMIDTGANRGRCAATHVLDTSALNDDVGDLVEAARWIDYASAAEHQHGEREYASGRVPVKSCACAWLHAGASFMLADTQPLASPTWTARLDRSCNVFVNFTDFAHFAHFACFRRLRTVLSVLSDC
jgi:hypothetical protein